MPRPSPYKYNLRWFEVERKKCNMCVHTTFHHDQAVTQLFHACAEPTATLLRKPYKRRILHYLQGGRFMMGNSFQNF
jgi:hypothetical protein